MGNIAPEGDSVPVSGGLEDIARTAQRVSFKAKEDQLIMSMTLRAEYKAGIEKMASAENLNFRGAILELLEEGLIKRGYLPEWWRRREFK